MDPRLIFNNKYLMCKGATIDLSNIRNVTISSPENKLFVDIDEKDLIVTWITNDSALKFKFKDEKIAKECLEYIKEQQNNFCEGRRIVKVY